MCWCPFSFFHHWPSVSLSSPLSLGMSKQKWLPLLEVSDDNDDDNIGQDMKNPVCVIFTFYIIPQFLIKTNTTIMHHVTMKSSSDSVSSACQKLKLVVWWHWHITYFSYADPPLYALVKVSDWEIYFLWPCQLPALLPAWKYCCKNTHTCFEERTKSYTDKIQQNCLSKPRDG